MTVIKRWFHWRILRESEDDTEVTSPFRLDTITL